jgi:hypothetical protein
MVYVECPIKFERKSKYFDSDTLHFSEDGYKHLGKFLADPVKKVLNIYNSFLRDI